MCSTFEQGGEQTGPNKPLSDGGVGRVEHVQICMRLTLFEQELYLPAQTIKLRDVLGGKAFARKVRVQVDEHLLIALVLLVQDHDAATVDLVLRDSPFDVQIDRFVWKHVPRESLAFQSPHRRAVHAERGSNRGVDALHPANDEGPSGIDDGGEVRSILVAPIAE